MATRASAATASAWGVFLDARAFLLRCLHDQGDSPAAILAQCNFADLEHLRAVLDNVKTGGMYEAKGPQPAAARDITVRHIGSPEDHAAALARIEALWNSPPDTRGFYELKILAALVEDYERHEEPRAMAKADPDNVCGYTGRRNCDCKECTRED